MFFLTKNFERIRSDRTTYLQFSEFFQMFLTCFLFFKLRKYLVLFSPCSHPASCPCAYDDTLKFLFIKKFQFFFSRIEIACIFVGRIGFEPLLCIVKFILQYVLLFFFSFALRLENCTTCALRLYLFNPKYIWQLTSALGQPDRHFSRNLPLVAIFI